MRVVVLRKILGAVALGLIAAVLFVGYTLAAMAVWFHLPASVGLTLAVAILALGVVGAIGVLAIRGKRARLIGLTVMPLIAALIWWTQITPSNDRIWAPELAQTVTAGIDGSQVTLANIRNFSWRSGDDFDARWETQTYDLNALESVDVALSYWGLDKIAHVLVSFGFADGEQVVFSVEIRKELGESFSELGGLFKQFELSLIAAKEEDILFLRTNARDPLEDVYLYPLRVDAKSRQALFLSYANLGNQLAETPYWYNTITANCTTVIYRLVRSFSPNRRFDPRFVLSGGLPEYFVEHDMLAWPEPLGNYRARAAISAWAQDIQHGQNYSRVIRGE